MNKFELWYEEIDTTFIGLEQAESKVKAYHLYPYSRVKMKDALTVRALKQRIKIVDKAILKCKEL